MKRCSLPSTNSLLAPCPLPPDHPLPHHHPHWEEVRRDIDMLEKQLEDERTTTRALMQELKVWISDAIRDAVKAEKPSK